MAPVSPVKILGVLIMSTSDNLSLIVVVPVLVLFHVFESLLSEVIDTVLLSIYQLTNHHEIVQFIVILHVCHTLSVHVLKII